MLREWIYVECGNPDCAGDDAGNDRRRLNRDDAPDSWFEDGKPYQATQATTGGTLLFDCHSKAIRAMERAGWRPSSESIGGDTCAACLEAELVVDEDPEQDEALLMRELAATFSALGNSHEAKRYRLKARELEESAE